MVYFYVTQRHVTSLNIMWRRVTQCNYWNINYITFIWFTMGLFSKCTKNVNILNFIMVIPYEFFLLSKSLQDLLQHRCCSEMKRQQENAFMKYLRIKTSFFDVHQVMKQMGGDKIQWSIGRIFAMTLMNVKTSYFNSFIYLLFILRSFLCINCEGSMKIVQNRQCRKVINHLVQPY